jgi:hypothetical protein
MGRPHASPPTGSNRGRATTYAELDLLSNHLGKMGTNPYGVPSERGCLDEDHKIIVGIIDIFEEWTLFT